MRPRPVSSVTFVRIIGLALLFAQSLLVYRVVSGGTQPSNLTSEYNNSGATIQAARGYLNRTFLTTHTTVPFDSSGGDLIIVCASSHAGVVMTPSDSFKNTWISGIGPTNTRTGFNLRSQLWYAKSPAVGAGHTFTLNLSAPQSLVISLLVIKGSNRSDPIDAISEIGDDQGTQSLRVTSPNITIKGANDLLIGFGKSSVSETWTAGDGFTLQRMASSDFLDSETAWARKPGTYSSTFDISSLGKWQALAVAIRPATDGSVHASDATKATVVNH